ncbi:MAG: chemotaxis protein CheW [Clostridiales Family XIII bacterium]|jgi:purine-binding chemotaxis protein CheW|nr:chemotaxis protein CheW [Clostridiales Family XIII bacterium]
MAEYNDITEEKDTQHGRYLTFTIEDNVYGIPIRFVSEIIGMQNITRVPRTPEDIKGIINLRGKIVPLIDIRIKFGKEEIPYTERTCIIVIDINDLNVGFIVDMVDDVLTIDDEHITPVPTGRLGQENKYIEAIGKMGDKVQLLLNSEKLLKNDEFELLEEITADQTL